MDGSFLSDPAVIAASRSFVCARLATYECAEEEKLLESIFVGRSGDLENTTFTILAPDGMTKLARAGRSPSFAYGRAADAPKRMAEDMARIAKRYPGRKDATKDAPLPLVEDVRLGVNVAACDNLPLVIVVGQDDAQRKALEATLAPLAWDERYMGRFLYASTAKGAELEEIDAAKRAPGWLIVQPGTFGLDGKALVQVPADAKEKTLRAALDRALERFDAKAKPDYREHVRRGHREGVHWETEIPVTDPGRGPPGKGGPPPR